MLFAQTIDQLVENPLLIQVQTDKNWNYESEFFLDTIYNSVNSNQYATADEFINKLLLQQPHNVQILQLAIHIKMGLKNWSEARACLVSLLEQAPDNLPALVRLGYVNSRLENWGLAIINYETALRGNPSPELKAYIENALTQARQHYTIDEDQTSVEWAALWHDLEALEAGGRWLEVERRADAYLTLKPDDFEAVLLRGRARLAQDKFADADRDFLLVLENDEAAGFHAAALSGLLDTQNKVQEQDWRLAAELEKDGRLDELEALLRQMHAKQPDNAAILVKLAETRLKLGPEHAAAARSDLLAAQRLPYMAQADRSAIARLLPESEAAMEAWETILAERRAAELEQARIQAEMEAKMAAGMQLSAFSNSLAKAEKAAALMYRRALTPGTSLDWPAIVAVQETLTQKRDWRALQQFYTDFIAAHPQEAFGYFSRGFMLQSQGRYGDAARDFTGALEWERDVGMRETIENALADVNGKLAEQSRVTEEQALLKELDRRAAVFVAAEDWRGLTALYDQYLDRYPQNALLWARRGYARLDLGLAEAGRQDLRTALGLKPDYDLKAGITATLRDLENREARGETIGSFRADGLIWEAAELITQEQFGEASRLLLKLEDLILSAPQRGMQAYLNAQVLWYAKQYDEAFPLFETATADLTQDFYRAEAYARMAEYRQQRNDLAAARLYIDKALAKNPDNAWRNIQAGDIYAQSRDSKKALEYYNQALEIGGIAPESIYFYGYMAQTYQELGDREKFDFFARRNIDAEQSRINLKGRPTAEDLEKLHALKRDFSNAASSPYGGSIYAFHNQYHDNDHITSVTVELKRTQTVRNYRTELYAKVGSNISTSFSGTYFNPWSGNNESWEGQSYFRDDLYAAAGVRVFPFAALDLNFGFEQRFKIGDNTDNDTLVYANLYQAIGEDWEPVKDHWLYASVYSQVNYSLTDDDVTYGGDVKVGYSAYVPFTDRLVTVTPFWGISPSYGGKNAEKGGRWGLDTGPGIIITKWFDANDAYRVPVKNINFTIQYKSGLSHGTKDYFMFSTYFGF